MRMIIKNLSFLLTVAIFALSLPNASMASSTSYTPPSASGLSAIRAYPSSGHVCQLLRVTANIKKYKKKGKRLIACPSHEKGAIADRRRAGAKKVGRKGSWVILRIR
ncbi:MAG: hypothetical protein ACPGVN_08460 [Alphaproteobacteria bacterium]